jgi:hypothetical protein
VLSGRTRGATAVPPSLPGGTAAPAGTGGQEAGEQ